jgi:hypothetical protein
MLGPAWIFGMVTYDVFFSDHTWSCTTIPEAEAQKIISERADARFRLYNISLAQDWKSGCPKITGSPNQRRGMIPYIQL